MKKLAVQVLVLLPLTAVLLCAVPNVHAAKYFYAPVAVVPAAPIYYAPPAVFYAAPVLVQSVLVQPVPVVVETAPVAVQPVAVAPVPNRVVNRGLFNATKETVTGRPGHERYHYHVHRLFAPNYHYTVKNDLGYVRVQERRTW